MGRLFILLVTLGALLCAGCAQHTTRPPQGEASSLQRWLDTELAPYLAQQLDQHPRFIVLELLKGQELADMVKERGPLPPEEVDLFLSQTAMALGSAFQKVNFLRDLKADFDGLERTYFPNTNLLELDEVRNRLAEAIA